MYQYYDMDKVIAAALKAAEKEFGEEERSGRRKMIRKVTKQRQEEQLLEWPESFTGKRS